MKNILFLLIWVLFIVEINAQQYSIRGNIIDSESNQPLAYANIRVLNSNSGTAANKYGQYELKLNKGNYQITASFIGFNSDTITILVDRDLDEINFQLDPVRISLPEITVLPGENPALRIIRNAIERKKDRYSKLNSYELEAYTKGVIWSQDEISGRYNSVGASLGTSDTSALKITGIIENQSKSFFKKPDLHKDIVIARKQSSNFPSSINTLTGGRLIQNFYEEDVSFFGGNIPGPISEDALDYYYFIISSMAAIDNKLVYKIHIEPDNSSDPGFVGFLYIADSTFDLIKAELQLNRAANTGGLLDSIFIFQQYSIFDSIYMPVDYRIFVNGNVLGLFKFAFELNTLLYNHKINPPLTDNFFDKAIITVKSDADQKDSVYWTGSQTIPNTNEEKSAYKRIDSIKNVPASFWDEFSVLSSRIGISNNFSVSAPLSMYHFNRVEGHAVDFGMYTEDLFNSRFNSSLDLSYGFADKRFKSDLSANYLFGEYRTTRLSLNAYKRLSVLFGGSESYNNFITTLLALLAKDDFRDYFYSTGFDMELRGEIFPVLLLKGGFINRRDRNASKNTNISVFSKNKLYRENPSIYETKINALTAGFRLDFRDFIEDGLYRRRTSFGSSYILFDGDITYSNSDLLKSSLDFTQYELNVLSNIRSFRTTYLRVNIYSRYTDGYLPYQWLYALPGNINLTARNFSFRTLNINEIFGDRIVSFNSEYYFNDELFRMSRIPLLKDSELQFKIFFNAAVTEINEKSGSIIPFSVKTFNKPFYEIGFGIGHVLIPIEFEFAWKLNYRNDNNFRFGMNVFLIEE